jgi:UDP-glucose 4-epimerase
MVVPNFVRQALTGQEITVFGDGTQSRCFCHVHDVVTALADLMERDDLYGEVFNIGSQEEITIGELAERVRDLVGSSAAIRRVPYDEAYEQGFEDMQRRVPDISKINSVLGWAPTRSLDEIILDVQAHQLEAAKLSALAA